MHLVTFQRVTTEGLAILWQKYIRGRGKLPGQRGRRSQKAQIWAKSFKNYSLIDFKIKWLRLLPVSGCGEGHCWHCLCCLWIPSHPLLWEPLQQKQSAEDGQVLWGVLWRFAAERYSARLSGKKQGPISKNLKAIFVQFKSHFCAF